MFLQEFNQSPKQRIKKLNTLLEKEFGVSVKSFPSKEKLTKLLETANTVLIKLRSSNKKFQLDPEYAKFLGIRDIAQTMLAEGNYAESAAYMEMKGSLEETVRELMDSGYTQEDACNECLMRFRMNPNFGYSDDEVKPIIMLAAQKYVDECSTSAGMVANSAITDTGMNAKLLAELARECGVHVDDVTAIDAIEEKLQAFAEVSGKSRDAIVGFLNGLEEDAVVGGIQMFGRKIATENAYNQAAAAAKRDGKKEFEFPPGSGKMHPVTMDGDTAEKLDDDIQESMFDDILNEIINEEVDVEQAEVVMAVRALADDIQDQIERLGRMMNEDVPAIADQMRSEMGASQAQQWVDSTTGTLSGHLESAKATKSAMDQAVAGLTGEEAVGGLGDTGLADAPADAMAEPAADPMAPMADEEPVDNVPAASGPEEEPMGRAEV